MARVSIAAFALLSIPVIQAAQIHGRADVEAAELTTYSAASYAGSATSYIFPPAVTAYGSSVSSYFPPESVVGYPGPTPTGDEPELVATGISAPVITDDFPLVAAPPLGKQSTQFDIFSKWGVLSPQKSIPPTDLPESSEIIPDGCTLDQVHILTRHASRYPTTGSAQAKFAAKIQGIRKNNTGFTASGDLEFLNTWTYKLGSEILTPHGRGQLYRLGVKHAVEYGHLLVGFNKTLITRTTSQDRMYETGLTYREGFFGREYDKVSQMSIIIESSQFNNTLAPYYVCNNSNTDAIYGFGDADVLKFQTNYLQNALARISAQVVGINFTISDLVTMQQMCAYETVALGYSSFCSLFTIDEWESYSYSSDLSSYYDSSFGNPVSAALGLGYAQEVLSRLTQTPITVSNSSVNTTLSANKITFPLDQPIYIDHTHDSIISTIIVALNFTTFNSPAPLPLDKIPTRRGYKVFSISPFAAQLVGQVMTCPSRSSTVSQGKYVRWVVNDAVVSQTGMGKCPYDLDGLCPLDVYIAALEQRNQEIDFNYACNGKYNATVGQITNGQPPPKPKN